MRGQSLRRNHQSLRQDLGGLAACVIIYLQLSKLPPHTLYSAYSLLRQMRQVMSVHVGRWGRIQACSKLFQKVYLFFFILFYFNFLILLILGFWVVFFWFKFNLYTGNKMSVTETGFHFRPDVYKNARIHCFYVLCIIPLVVHFPFCIMTMRISISFTVQYNNNNFY